MDGISKAHIALTGLNTAGLIALTFYVYKSNSSMKTDMGKIAESLKSTISTVDAMRQNNANIPKLLDAVSALNDDLQNTKSNLDSMISSMESNTLQFSELYHKINSSLNEISANANIDVTPIELYSQMYNQRQMYSQQMGQQYPQQMGHQHIHQMQRGGPPPLPYAPPVPQPLQPLQQPQQPQQPQPSYSNPMYPQHQHYAPPPQPQHHPPAYHQVRQQTRPQQQTRSQQQQQPHPQAADPVETIDDQGDFDANDVLAAARANRGGRGGPVPAPNTVPGQGRRGR